MTNGRSCQVEDFGGNVAIKGRLRDYERESVVKSDRGKDVPPLEFRTGIQNTSEGKK